MTHVLLDTSFILTAFRLRRLDLLEIRQVAGGKIAIPSAVSAELRKLGKAAVLEYLVANGCVLLPGDEKYADAEIISLVRRAQGRTIVGTQDAALVAKLKAFKGKCGILFVRGKKKLVILAGGTP